MKLFVSLFFLLCLSSIQAQAVILNGQTLAGARSDLLSGYSYAPAQELALIINAKLIDEGSKLSFYYLGQLLSYDIAATASEALLNTGSLRLNGKAMASTAALRHNGDVYIPIRSFVEALGGDIDYIPRENSVIALTPRAELKDISLKRLGQSERLSLSFSYFSSYSQSYRAENSSLLFVFNHASSESNWQAGGHLSSLISLEAKHGQLWLELKLKPGVQYDSFVLAQGQGFELNIDLFETGPVANKVLMVVYESATLALAEILYDNLYSIFDVRLRSHLNSQPAKADMVLMLTTNAKLQSSSFNLFYPQSQNLDYLLFANSSFQTTEEALLDPFRIDSLALQRGAELFSRRFSLNSGFVPNTFSSAPLATVFLGKTIILVELATDDLGKSGLSEALQRTLAELLVQ